MIADTNGKQLSLHGKEIDREVKEVRALALITTTSTSTTTTTTMRH